MNIILKNESQIELMKKSGKVLSDTFEYIEAFIKPGVSTYEIDKLCEEFIRSQGAIPSSKGYCGYPASVCASVNDVVVHGIPSKKTILKEGDILSLDITVVKHGYNTDAARTFAVGKISPEKQKLIDVTRECFFEGIKGIKIGDTLNDIARNIQTHAEKNGFSVVRDMIGHGIGKEMHEDPPVPNYFTPENTTKIEKGLVIALEPMINYGRKEIYIESDGWTARTRDHKPSAHYENTIAFTDKGVEILTIK